MANKRMFSKQIISTDDFLDMPLSTQALYFHLAVNADDDGFIAPKSIVRLVGANDDDLKVLLTKKFLIPFEDRVVVITHWKLHNTIKKDRYIPTEYQIYRSQLTSDGSKMYTNVIPDKVRLDKVSKDKKRENLIQEGFNGFLRDKKEGK